jgi:uncharacterized protein YvpB
MNKFWKKSILGLLAIGMFTTTQVANVHADNVNYHNTSALSPNSKGTNLDKTTITANKSNKTNLNQTPLTKNSYLVVSYLPNKSIHLYTRNNMNQFQRNGKVIKNGATLKTYTMVKSGNSTYYYVGKKQWVNSKNVIKYALKHTRYNVLKNSPKSQQYYTSQYFPVFAPWGCASSALSMLMKYDGTWNKVSGSTDTAKLTYMQNNLPRNRATGGQDGDPYTGKGFTRVILSYCLMNYAHQLGDKKIKDVSGISMNNLKQLVLANHPVLYYGYSSYNDTGARNHAKVIFGYSKKSDQFLVHDPLYQAKRFYEGGGGRNRYDLGPISWVKASSVKSEFAYKGGNNALTVK